MIRFAAESSLRELSLLLVIHVIRSFNGTLNSISTNTVRFDESSSSWIFALFDVEHEEGSWSCACRRTRVRLQNAVFFRSLSLDVIRGVLFIFSKKSVSRGMRIFQSRVSVARLCTGKLLCRMKLLFDVSKFVSDV